MEMDDGEETSPKAFGGRVSHMNPDSDDATSKKYIAYRATRLGSFPDWEKERVEAIQRAMHRKATDSHDAADNDVDDVGFWNEDASEDWEKWGNEITSIPGTSSVDDWESAVWYPPGEAEEYIEMLGVCESELGLQDSEDEDRIAAAVVLTVLRNFLNSSASTNHLLFGVLLVCVFGRAIRVHEKCMYEWSGNAWVMNMNTNFSMKDFVRLSRTLEIAEAMATMAPIGNPLWYNAPVPEIRCAASFFSQEKGLGRDCTFSDLLLLYSAKKMTTKAYRASVVIREARNALLQNRSGMMNLYLDWADTKFDITTCKYISFSDCKLDIFGAKLFIPCDIVDQCYRKIPRSLCYAAPDHSIRRLQRFLTTSFAGTGALPLFISACALVAGNRPLPDIILALHGSGGDGKTLILMLLKNAFGDLYGGAPNSIFQKQEEFRIQAINIKNKQVVGMDEMNKNLNIEEDVLKSVLSGSPQCVRPLHARETLMLSWKVCLWVWCFNTNDAPAVKHALGQAHARRWRGVCLESNFTGSSSDVNTSDKVFRRDDDLKLFLESGVAALIFWRYIIAPWVRDPESGRVRRTPNDCRNDLTDPTDSVKRSTTILLCKMSGVAYTDGMENGVFAFASNTRRCLEAETSTATSVKINGDIFYRIHRALCLKLGRGHDFWRSVIPHLSKADLLHVGVFDFYGNKLTKVIRDALEFCPSMNGVISFEQASAQGFAKYRKSRRRYFNSCLLHELSSQIASEAQSDVTSIFGSVEDWFSPPQMQFVDFTLSGKTIQAEPISMDVLFSLSKRHSASASASPDVGPPEKYASRPKRDFDYLVRIESPLEFELVEPVNAGAIQSYISRPECSQSEYRALNSILTRFIDRAAVKYAKLAVGNTPMRYGRYYPDGSTLATVGTNLRRIALQGNGTVLDFDIQCAFHSIALAYASALGINATNLRSYVDHKNEWRKLFQEYYDHGLDVDDREKKKRAKIRASASILGICWPPVGDSIDSQLPYGVIPQHEALCCEMASINESILQSEIGMELLRTLSDREFPRRSLARHFGFLPVVNMHDGVITLGNGNEKKLIEEFQKRTKLRIECVLLSPTSSMTPLRAIETEISKIAPVEAEHAIVEGPFTCALFAILSPTAGEDYIAPPTYFSTHPTLKFVLNLLSDANRGFSYEYSEIDGSMLADVAGRPGSFALLISIEEKHCVGISARCDVMQLWARSGPREFPLSSLAAFADSIGVDMNLFAPIRILLAQKCNDMDAKHPAKRARSSILECMCPLLEMHVGASSESDSASSCSTGSLRGDSDASQSRSSLPCDAASIFENRARIERRTHMLDLAKTYSSHSCALCLSRDFSRKQYLMNHMRKYHSEQSPIFTCDAQRSLAKTSYDTWVAQSACRAVHGSVGEAAPFSLTRKYFDAMSKGCRVSAARNDFSRSYSKALCSSGTMFVLRSDISEVDFRRAGNVIFTPGFANAIFREFVISPSIKSVRSILRRWIPMGDLLPSRSSCYENVLADLFSGEEVAALKSVLRNRIYELEELTHIGVDGTFKMSLPLANQPPRTSKKENKAAARSITGECGSYCVISITGRTGRLIGLYTCESENHISISDAIASCVPAEMRHKVRHVCVDEWSRKLHDAVKNILPHATVGQDYMHLVFSVQSSLRRFKFGRGSSNLIRVLKLVGKKLMRTTCDQSTHSTEGSVQNQKFDEKTLIEGIENMDVGFSGYAEYVETLKAISDNSELRDWLQKKTVNGYTCRQTILNHCRLSAPHVWTDVVNRWKDSPFGTTSNEGAHFSLISTFGRNNRIMHRPLYRLKLDALLINKQLSQYNPEDLLIQRGPVEVLGMALSNGIFRRGDMSFSGGDAASNRECDEGASTSGDSGAACSSVAALLKSSAASEYACSVGVEAEKFSRLGPSTSKKRYRKIVNTQDARRNIFKQVKRPPAKF